MTETTESLNFPLEVHLIHANSARATTYVPPSALHAIHISVTNAGQSKLRIDQESLALMGVYPMKSQITKW